MSKTLRFSIYGAAIGIYILFGIIGGWESIWPWGAVIIGVPILLAEGGLYLTRKK